MDPAKRERSLTPFAFHTPESKPAPTPGRRPAPPKPPSIAPKTTSMKLKPRASKLPNVPSRKSTGVRKRKAAASRTPAQNYHRQEIKFMLEEMSKMTRWQELGERMNETFKTKRRYGNIKEHFKTIVSARALEGYPELVE